MATPFQKAWAPGASVASCRPSLKNRPACPASTVTTLVSSRTRAHTPLTRAHARAPPGARAQSRRHQRIANGEAPSALPARPMLERCSRPMRLASAAARKGTMKARLRLLVSCVLVSLSLGHATVSAESDHGKTRTLSPYFFVENGDPSVDHLPLKDTRVDVKVLGVIADVTVRQIYENRGERPIHARYVFPASTRAAVYAMSMTVGDRRIVARIKEREQAKQQFEQAKREGKSASLLEQSRPNVFSMNVANILPGDTVSVELSYTELLVPTAGIYEFVYPTVVGPRYSSQTAEEA